ncbi:MAG: tetratricopeptide repeat protein [Planctomycetota bacterium]
MTDIICPMLSALKPVDDFGRPVDRECIYESCRFFNAEQRDCGLMMAGRAMLSLAERSGEKDAARESPADMAAGIERRLGDASRELLQATRDVGDAVRDAAGTTGDRVAALEARLAQLEASLARRLEESESRLVGSVRDHLEAAADRIRSALESGLAERCGPIADALAGLRSTVEEQGSGLTARLDEALRGVREMVASVPQLGPQLGALTELQQKAAEKILEEISLAAASVKKLDGTLAEFGGRLERIASESLQFSQIVTLVKGETERTYAALRKINEGNRSVVEAIETQLQRDRAELQRRQREEALNHNNRGVVLYYRGAFEAAVDSFRQALQLQSDYAEAYNNLGLALSRMGRETEATEAFERALKIDPKMGEVYNNLGFLYHTAAQFERAAQMFGQAIDNAADSSVAYTNLGNTFYKLQQPDKAIGAWRRALELDPMNENARRGLRMFQQDAGDGGERTP